MKISSVWKITLQIRNIYENLLNKVCKIFQVMLEFFSVSGLRFKILSDICRVNSAELK